MSEGLPLFRLEEHAASEVLAGLGSYTACVNDPPWSQLASQVPPPARVVAAWEMELSHLEGLLEGEPDSEVVVGLGGGSALDTAKFIAWRTGKPLVQIPTITSVDAGFTDAVGVRVDRKVTYIGQVVPEMVVLDVDLVRSAPPRLNRAGIGDVLSCHTGLWDWRMAAELGEGVSWDERWARLGRRLLAELADMADEVRRVSPDAVRWLASAYQRIGAACHVAGHSRFEEGSEHFLAYCYEYLTGAHQVHGELISMCVVALATLQDNQPEQAREIVTRAGVRAHPEALGIDWATFQQAVLALPGYVREQGLDFSVVDVTEVDQATAARLWQAVVDLPGDRG